NKALQKEAGAAALKRMFLHAWRLKFTHPSSGKRIELRAALPPDLESFTIHAVSLQATEL
ncbi:MAG: hypothetical protein ACT6Q9_13835, partial [Polaromonas sp.]